MSDPDLRKRVALRGAGLRRLQRLTGVAALGTAALAAAFTALAARSFPGHRNVGTVVPTLAHAPRPASRRPASVPPPPALPARSAAQSATPLVPAPAPAPAPVQQQPVVVSGGS
jgi:hypothetical protein